MLSNARLVGIDSALLHMQRLITASLSLSLLYKDFAICLGCSPVLVQ